MPKAASMPCVTRMANLPSRERFGEKRSAPRGEPCMQVVHHVQGQAHTAVAHSVQAAAPGARWAQVMLVEWGHGRRRAQEAGGCGHAATKVPG